jgi:outer membrane protein assembly factor BamB
MKKHCFLILVTGFGLIAGAARAPVGIHVLWTRAGASNPSYEWVTMSAVGDGIVYSVFPGKTWDYATESGRFTETGAAIVALDLSTGRERWSAESRWPILSPLLLSGGRLIAHNGYDEIFCFDAADGSLLWKVDPELHPGSWDERSMPSADGNHLYLREQNEIVCRNLADGRTVWRTAVDAVRNLRIYAVPAGDRIFVSNGMDAVIALDAQNGHILWIKALPAIRENPAAAPGMFLVSDAAGISNLAAADGRELWKIEDAAVMATGEAGAFIIQKPASHPEGGIAAAQIVCLDLERGQTRRWSAAVSSEFQGFSLAGPFALSIEAGKVVARGIADGKTCWEFQVPGEGRLQGQPLAFQGKILVAGTSGLTCIETGDVRVTGWFQSGGGAARAHAGR